MTGRELLLKAVRGEATPRPAWLPYVGVHGGHLIGEPADRYLQSSELMIRGLKAAHERYKPDGLPVSFDLQLEAEVLGCELRWAEKTPPSVVTHPLSAMEGPGLALEDLPAFSVEKGRFPLILETLDELRATWGETTALYGLLTGPFTLALHLLGNEIFITMYDDPDGLRRILDYCADVGCAVADAYLEHGVDVVAVVDPMTSQISEEHFRDFVSPAVDRVFTHVKEKNGLGSMFVCGDATRNLAAMADTQCNNVAIDEQIDLAQIRDLTVPHGKSFGGNLKLTAVLLLGDADASKLDALRCIDSAGDQGFVLAPGCDLPYDVKPENLEAVAEMVHDSYARDVARASLTAGEGDDFADIEIPDYASEAGVIVDVVTLDSESCAPCQYMYRAAVDAAAAVTEGTAITVREHKITTREGIGMMVKLGATSLPSIFINGECAYASVIPAGNTLVTALQRAQTDKAETASAAL